ncbi:MAG TPA: helix-turn-helix domain-containing GNAT family N-acetyltransferase [Xanthomonadales bacterium]|nr:helix-turn-helix domain-containing GNAT family N-acetyltransferase [Xanthomonadales bacterium]
MKDQTPHIRQASRQIVRELHLLDQGQEVAGHRFAECHVLLELEALGQATASELCERLVLEKSRVSRLVNTLVQRGAVQTLPNPADGRQRLLSLTTAGRRSLKPIHQHSNEQVDAALSCLPPREREEVLAGLGRYAKALRYARLSGKYRLRPMRRSDNPAVARIIRDVMTEYGAVGCGFSIQDAEVDAMFEAYPAPKAGFFVLEKDRVVLGCGGFAPLAGAADDVCELRKMYYRPVLRGQGQGARLLGHILEAMRAAGYRLCYLETLQSMTHAQRLYQRHGFESHDGPMGNTGHTACNRFMTLVL